MNLGPAAVSPPPVAAAAGIIGLETRDALYTIHNHGQNRQHHSSGVVVDMGKVVGVLRGHVPHRGGGGAHGLAYVDDDDDDDEEEEEEEEGGEEEHLGCSLSLLFSSF